MTRIYSADALAPLAQHLQQGDVLAYPTEAVFGLGCDPGDEAAVLRICTLKQRDPGQGLLLVAADLAQLDRYIDLAGVPPALRAEMAASWPGPNTWVVPRTASAPPWIAGDKTGIAVRVTAHPWVVQLCRQWGGPLVSTSANPHGAPPARSVQEVLAYFAPELPAVADAPLGRQQRPSVIRDALTGEVLRP